MQLRHRHEATTFFRYLSATKVNRLLKGDFPVSAGGFSVFGTGASLTIKSSSLRARLERVMSALRNDQSLGDLSKLGSNFIAGRDRFVEYLMREVVIWIARTNNTILLLGGSSRFLNFDNFNGHELPGVMPGSNRTAILNALTTLWRTARSQDSGSIITDPRTIEFSETFHGSINGSQVVTEAHDEIPYPVEAVVPRSISDYMREARSAYDLCPDYLVDNLEYAAVIYTDYVFPDDESPERARACETPIREGDRIVIGSPLYIAQTGPSGSSVGCPQESS